MKSFEIKQNDANQRIDSFIKKAFPKLSLTQIYKFIRIKRIKVNNKKIENNYRLVLNDKIDLYINDDFLSNEKSDNDFLKSHDDLNVVFEDENIIIVNKPIGIVVQPDEIQTFDTLSNRLLKYLYNKKF
jgi:23S rRNA pseudouridine955/2504/2580 synthase